MKVNEMQSKLDGSINNSKIREKELNDKID